MALSTQKRNSRNIIKEGLGRRGRREREEKREDLPQAQVHAGDKSGVCRV